MSSAGAPARAVAAPEPVATVAPKATIATLATPQFRRYGVADGVPAGTIYAAAQDHNGLMWFGGAAGLIRFDGVDFKVFRHLASDSQSLPVEDVYTLLVGHNNQIWVGGLSSGLAVYDQASERFKYWKHDAHIADSLASDEVWSVAQTSDGRLWVATQDGLDRMRVDGRGFDHIPLQLAGTPAASFGETRALMADADGRLWIGTESGLYVRERDGRVRAVPIDKAFHGDVGKVWRIDGTAGDVRVSLNAGLLVIGADGVARLLPGSEQSRRVFSSTRDTQGRLWLGTGDGMLLDNGDGHLQVIAAQPLLPGGLPGTGTRQTTLDREGGLWMTFGQSGIAYLPPGWSGFTRFTHIPDDPNSLSNIGAAAILLGTDGKLWVGGDNGWLDRLNVTTGAVEHVPQRAHVQVASLAQDAHGRLWINSPGALQVLDHGVLTDIDLASAGVTRPVLLSAGDDGRMYVASWGEGVFAVDTTTHRVQRIPLQGSPGSGNVQLSAQLTFHAGSLWYASAAGLQRWDSASKELAFVPGVDTCNVLTFAFDASGFWLATHQVLDHYQYANGRATRDKRIDITRYSFAPDLSDLRVDKQDHLWVFANPGLWRLNDATRQFQSFGPPQGLSSANFSSSAMALAADGTMYAATSDGVVKFRPDRFTHPDTDGAPPPVLLQRLTVRRHGLLRRLPLAGNEVHLNWRDRDLRVMARVASFVDPRVNRYRFHLSPFDTGWIDADYRGERDFAGLPAGNYTLHIQAAGATGSWGKLATPLHIYVQAVPWVRWWAWLIYALLLLLLLGAIFYTWRRRLAQLHCLQLAEQQRQLAEHASAAKTQFLATLSHEIRTPMTGVMGMAELLLTTPLNQLQHDYTQAMQRSGGMLLKLLNDALDLARIEAGKLELEPAPFSPRQLAEEVAQLEQGVAHARGLVFQLDLAADLPERVVGDAVRIKQVLLNLANNGLKFTERGSVTLRVQRRQGGLEFSVVDTGPGIPEASQARLFQRFEQEETPQRRTGSGLGLAICRELVSVMGGSIELESRLGHGSAFHVRLPLLEPPAATVLPPHADDDATYHLLLVEDDAIVAAVVRGLLERGGHQVCHVSNGLAALSELAQASFTAVLLDLDLPGVDGFQIARLIRQREVAGRRLPIIAVTARSGENDAVRARAAGMDGFLRKPLSGEQLISALKRVIAASTVGGDSADDTSLLGAGLD
ncbi:MAG: ATP-binding protein [Rhodanobacter sp.]